MPNLSTWALNHRPLVRYLIAVLLLGGVWSYFGLGQDEDPPFTFRAMVVRSYWPGATAQQMAEQVADKIEKKLQEVPYADKIRTYTKPGEMLTILQLKDSSPPKDVANSFYTTRKTIGDIKQDLPAGVIGPFFNDDFGDVYGVMFAFSADGYNYAQLKDYVEQTRQQLLRVKDVAKVQLFGVQDEKIYLDFNHERLAQQGIDLNAVLAQITGQLDVSASGSITTATTNVPVRVTGQTSALAVLQAMPIKVGQTTMRLGDLARVRRDFVEPVQQKIRQNDKDIILLGVSMAKGGDIIELGKSLAVAEAQIEAGLPVGIEMDKVQDQPRVVAGSVNEFLRTLVEAVVIVLVVSFLALGLHKNEVLKNSKWRLPFVLDWRPGLVVGLTIPLVLAMTFLVMGMTNTNLHKISLGALIIALGLLVDDAIIAVEMMVRKLEEGMNKLEAATFAFKATAFPMLTGTLITAVGFLPIAMAKSTAGEYTFTIFSVTTMALILSWIAAVIFTPYLGFLILQERTEGVQTGASDAHHDVFNTPALNALRRAVTWCVKHPWKVIAATLLAFVLGIVGMGKVEQQFFPDSSRLEVMVDVWLPEGSSYAQTDSEVRKVEAWLKRQPEVASYTSNIGVGSQRFVLTLDQIFPQTNVAQIVVMPKSLPERNALRDRLEQAFRTELTSVRGRAKLLPNGPPVNYPVQFRVEGTDASVVRTIANQVKAVVAKNDHTLGVNDNWNESIYSVKLNIDQDQARALGVTSKSIAQATATLGGGAPVATFRDGDKQIDIVLRLFSGNAQSGVPKNHSLDELTQLNVFTNTGKAVPLTQIAKPELVFEPGVMWRENRNYAITVNADIKGNIQAPTVTGQINPLLAPIRAALPAGYNISVAGSQEESAKGQESIAAGMPLMLFITFTLLMLQLKSFSRSLLVFLTGPLGIIGAAGALLLFHRPFGFVALLGVIALMGMIQRNSVILIDQIEQHISEGDAPWRAIVDSAVRRARPIVLTAAAAILAMIPLTRSVFWGPMAVAIMGGLVVATLLTLLSLPAMYAAWFKVKVDTLDEK
ncbi:MAG: efflux RND transporter permease subunit [Cytophagales bacterium]|nr:efflux RND transporter permease subunit [Cytophagales bacterium]